MNKYLFLFIIFLGIYYFGSFSKISLPIVLGLAYTSLRKFSWVCLLIPVGYLLVYKVILLTEKGKEFHTFKEYKGGLNYYALPWMNNNMGILEFTIDKKQASEPIDWMTISAIEYIKLLKSKGYTEEQIRKL